MSHYAPLDETDKKMLAYKVEYPGMTDIDLGELVGLDRQQVNLRRTRKLWQDAFDEAVKPHDEFLNAKKQKAIRMYWKLASSKNENIAERVLSKLLMHWKILRIEAGELEPFDPIVIKMPIYNEQVIIQNNVKDEKDITPARS